MIPASYLYKDAFRQDWGDDFGRGTTEAVIEPHVPPSPPSPPLLRAARELIQLAFGPRHAAVPAARR